MAFYYTPFEFCNAVKGYLHRFLVRSTGLDSWIYLDSDILILNKLNPLFESLDRASILLCDHISAITESPIANPVETTVLKFGIYNGGVLGLRRSDVGKQFVEWFCDRVSRFGFADGRFFVDQLWLNLVPSLFGGYTVCRHPGANLGFWNLHERKLTGTAPQAILSDGEPLLFVHFAGWAIDKPREVTKYNSMYAGSAPALWSELGSAYRELLLANGYRETSAWPYAYNFFDNGEELTLDMRRLFYSRIERHEHIDGSPFSQWEGFRSLTRRNRFRGWYQGVSSATRRHFDQIMSEWSLGKLLR
jgi:hypothetical protein